MTRSQLQAAPNFDFSGGRDLTSRERDALKPQLARHILVDELASTEEFWQYVAEVRDGADPSRVAKVYANGPTRRGVIAELLSLASAPERPGAHEALGRLAPRSEQEDDVLRARAVQRMLRTAFYSDAKPHEGRGTYAYRDDFLGAIRDGARLIARRGARLCFQCDTKLSVYAKGRHDYCRDHRPRRKENAWAPGLRRQRERWITTTFEEAAKARDATAGSPHGD